MADIPIDKLLQRYETQLGSQQGQILQLQAGQAAEVEELQGILAAMQLQLNNVPKECPNCHEPIELPEPEPESDSPVLEAVPDAEAPRKPRKAAAKKAGARAKRS